VTPPETDPFDGVYEYAPTKSEIPPPCTFKPMEDVVKVGRDADDDAVQKVNMLLDKVKLLLLTVVPPATEPLDLMYEYAPSTSETPPPYTLAPMARKLEVLDVEDEAEQPVNVLLEIEKLLLLTVVSSKTVPSDGTYEYAPTKSEIPPPYTFAPLEESAPDTGERLDVNDDAEQAVNVLLEMERLELLTVVPPETEPARGTYEYAPTKSEIPPPYTFAPLEESAPDTGERLDANDDAEQAVNVLLEMERLELLTVVPPETEPARGTYEYAPTKSEIPPPYTFAPFEKMLLVTEESIDVNDEAVHEVIVFFEMV
jgi:hypothetical protein